MKKDLKIEAFVLAGGLSSRMGREKGLVDLRGRPMISYVLGTLRKSGLPVKIIANNSDYNNFDAPVIPDAVPKKGPLGGLFTALQNTKADLVLLVSCDMPFLSSEAVQWLLKAAEEEEIVAPLVKDRINPLFALYPTFLLENVKNALAAGELKMADFILKNPHCLVPSLSQKMPWIFENINDPDELKRAEEQWRHLL